MELQKPSSLPLTPPIPRRRVTLFDQLVLLVPLATAIPVTQAFWANELRYVDRYRPGQPWIMEVLDWVPIIVLGLIPRQLVLLMPALLAIRLRRPRPGRRRLARQPGAVACAAATAAAMAGGTVVGAMSFFQDRLYESWESFLWPIVESYVSTA